MARVRMVCGLAALIVLALSIRPGAAESLAVSCDRHLVPLGPVVGVGCWHRLPHGWRAPAPVTLDGLKLAGGGPVTIDASARTVRTAGPARWLIGPVQVLRAPFLLHVGHPLAFRASGALRGLPFSGIATLAFARVNGGTATLAATLGLPSFAGGALGEVKLRVSRLRGFSVRDVHVAVGSLPLGRILFKQLDFRFGAGVWAATAAVRLPAFAASAPTLLGRIEIANGSLHRIGLAGSGLQIPLGEGFILTKAGLDLGLGPLVIQGSGTANWGPSLAGRGALEVDGNLQYVAQPERWEAKGAVTLPWNLAGVAPKLDAGLEVQAGRAIVFNSNLDMTAHGFGLTGSLTGFASSRAFNVEGSSKLKLPLFSLSGQTLMSSRGMSACGAASFFFHHTRFGFGYTWGGSLDVMGSSCDVGHFRVAVSPRRRLLVSAPTTFELASPAEFAVFKAMGGDFTVTGPTGVFSSSPDRDTPQAFAFHDPTDKTAYLAIQTTVGDGFYTLTPNGGATLTDVTVANGLVTHAGTGDVTAGVVQNGSTFELQYGIDASQFQPGETVSFYEGQSPDDPGANPIVENTTSGGTQQFTPEPLGATARFVFAVVSIDGRPRETFPVAQFSYQPAAPPTATVAIGADPAGGGYVVQFLKPQRVALWQVTVAANGQPETYQELPGGSTASVTIPVTVAQPATVNVVPVDSFGRLGPTFVCSTAKLGTCPAG
jgi:hypothetical protein